MHWKYLQGCRVFHALPRYEFNPPPLHIVCFPMPYLLLLPSYDVPSSFPGNLLAAVPVCNGGVGGVISPKRVDCFYSPGDSLGCCYVPSGKLQMVSYRPIPSLLKKTTLEPRYWSREVAFSDPSNDGCIVHQTFCSEIRLCACRICHVFQT